jgi:hypothetical protein
MDRTIAPSAPVTPIHIPGTTHYEPGYSTHMTSTEPRAHVASFRDPNGYIYVEDGELFRRIQPAYLPHYEALTQSGLYDALVARDLLIAHKEVSTRDAKHGLTIAPTRVPFISYPAEWCFSQLKDAALATLTVEEEAIQYGLCLKDASAYNIQFVGGKPLLIDTLSFEKYTEGTPWVAYRQFCQHFLAPLALMACSDIRLGKLGTVAIDGTPLDLASRLLPLSTWFKPGLLIHLHLHARSQMRHASSRGVSTRLKNATISRTARLGLIDSLKSTIAKLKWQPGGTEWADYYDRTNYSEAALVEKGRLVEEFANKINPQTIWDLGGNTGHFSRIVARKGRFVLSGDIDPAAVEINYRAVKKQGNDEILPVVLDLTNPTPSYGWGGEERDSLEHRGPADLILALALIHHLAISNNVPLKKVAEYFSRLGKNLVIEFVPKEDSQVQILLSTRADIFPNYTKEGFEAAFQHYFQIVETRAIAGSKRWLYLMQKRS